MTLRRASLLGFLLLLLPSAGAHAMTGTIDLDRNFAWGENIGWMNFASEDSLGAYQGLVITDASVTGFVWSAAFGWINFGPSSSGQGVTNTAAGVLGGSAWVAGLGFIDMTGVTIDSGGEFRGTAGAVGSQAGRIAFDCANCDVHTTWRPMVSVPPSTPTSPGGGGGGPGSTPFPTGGGGGGSTTTPVSAPVQGPAPAGPIVRAPAARVPASGNAAASIAAVPEPDDAGAPASKVPDQLFDISLSLDDDTLVRGQDLVARAAFVNFGRAPTPIQMLFSIVDPSGKVLLTAEASTTVEIERSYPQTFAALDLAPGAYTLRLRTSYNGGVEDEFSRPFNVASRRTWVPWLGVVLAAGSAAFFLVFGRKRRGEEFDPYLI